MKVLKTIFWTTIFWLVLLLIVFIYAKYTASGESLANSIAKQLWVTPAAEVMVDTGSMAAEMSMSDLMKLQEAVMEIQMDVDKLLDMEMMAEEDLNGMNDDMMGSGDMIGSGDIMTGSMMDDTANETTTE